MQIRHSVGLAVADAASTPLPLGQPAVLAGPSAPAGAGRYSQVEAEVSGGRDDDFDPADDNVPGVRQRWKNQCLRVASGLEAD
jgi:hypothetical protein